MSIKKIEILLNEQTVLTQTTICEVSPLATQSHLCWSALLTCLCLHCNQVSPITGTNHAYDTGNDTGNEAGKRGECNHHAYDHTTGNDAGNETGKCGERYWYYHCSARSAYVCAPSSPSAQTLPLPGNRGKLPLLNPESGSVGRSIPPSVFPIFQQREKTKKKTHLQHTNKKANTKQPFLFFYVYTTIHKKKCKTRNRWA